MKQYNNYGRDQINIENASNLVINKLEPVRADAREIALLKSVTNEVNYRLDQSLHKATFINVDKEPQSKQVERPWDVEIKIGEKPSVLLHSNASILEIFEHPEIAHHLLILGEPGSGKTTVMLDLAKSVLCKAEQSITQPIPVILNLSSWRNPNQSIPNWLLGELYSKYGVGKRIGRIWLESKKLIPMLDGLDEVQIELQQSCIQAINSWLQGSDRPPSIVITSRKEEYVVHSHKLKLNGAILLKPLTDEQIQYFLNRIERPELNNLLQRNLDLKKLSKSPLLLSIIVLSFEGSNAEELEQIILKGQSTRSLVEIYIQRMFQRNLKSLAYRKSDAPCKSLAERWLSFLAEQLKAESKTEFLIEDIQPSWLSSNCLKRFYRIFFGMIYGFILITLWSWFFAGVFDFPPNLGAYVLRLPIAIVTGVLFGSAWGILFHDPIKQVKLIETLRWSSLKARVALKNGLNIWLLCSLILNLIVSGSTAWYIVLAFLAALITRSFFSTLIALNVFGAFEGSEIPLMIGLFACLTFGLCFIWIVGLTSGMDGSEVDIKMYPNQGILKTLSNACFIALIYGIIFGAMFAFFFGVLDGNINVIIDDWIFKLTVQNGLSEIKMGTVNHHFVLSASNYPYAFVSLRDKPIIGLILGLLVGIFLGLTKCGLNCVRHLSLRLALFQGGYIPWNYSRFLNYCTERLILQRVGGRYRFVHKILQDYFAEVHNATQTFVNEVK